MVAVRQTNVLGFLALLSEELFELLVTDAPEGESRGNLELRLLLLVLITLGHLSVTFLQTFSV